LVATEKARNKLNTSLKMLLWMLWAIVVWPLVALGVNLLNGGLGQQIAALWLLSNFAIAIFCHPELWKQKRKLLRWILSSALATATFLLTQAIVQRLCSEAVKGHAEPLILAYLASIILVFFGLYCLQSKNPPLTNYSRPSKSTSPSPI
jgi:hypothetical protein